MLFHSGLGRCFGLVVLGLLLAAPALAVDLTSIPREIGKLPELISPQPLYCLLVFGPEAKTCVWLVRDGDVLYADRNANGDLTDPGERFEPEATTSRPVDGILNFRIGDIADGEQLHKSLGVSWFNVDHLKGSHGDVTAQLERDPAFRAIGMQCDVTRVDHRGSGIDGRVPEKLVLGDANGLLRFSPSAESAPILHFGGPWQLTLYGKSELRIGRDQDVYLAVGTPGLGPGTSVWLAYAGVIPEEIRPRVTFTFAAESGEPIEMSYDFKQRCCEVNLYDAVSPPDGVVPGEAQVTLSLDAWSSGQVASSTAKVQILPPLPGPKLLPVSARLTSKLDHMHPEGGIHSVRFSPDGKRLVAADSPGGVVHIWELSTGKRLVNVDAAEGSRRSYGGFHVSPDWQRIYTATQNRGTYDRVERDGQALNRVTYSDAVRVWDANTGERLHTWQQDPPRGILTSLLSPNGQQLIVQEETPGEFSGAPPRALTLLDVETMTHRQVAEGFYWVQAVTDNGCLAAVTIPQVGEVSYHEAIGIFELPAWKEKSRIPIGGLQEAGVSTFAKNDQVVIGYVRRCAKRDEWQNAQWELKFWNATSGKELHTVEPASPREQLSSAQVSPDGSLAAVFGIDRDAGKSRILLVNLDNWSTVEIPFQENAFLRASAFHPSGKWLAVSRLILPKVQKSRRDPEVSSLEQPRIDLIDVANGKLLETMIAPQSFQVSIAYSPDGNTLATGSQGAVLLWDMTTSPGASSKQPVVGETVELVGTRVDGTPLDAADYRGKVTLVSFWATWCQPCVAEMPELKSIYHELHDRGFEVLGVSLDEPDVDLAAFAKNQDLPWAVLRGTSADSSGENLPLARRLGVTSVPRSFLLDREGKIVAIDPKLHELEKLTVPMLDANAK